VLLVGAAGLVLGVLRMRRWSAAAAT